MTSDTRYSPEPHDVLTIGLTGPSWVVTGVFLGGESQESVIGLQVCGERLDASAYGKSLPELFVPESLIRVALFGGGAHLHKAAA